MQMKPQLLNFWLTADLLNSDIQFYNDLLRKMNSICYSLTNSFVKDFEEVTARVNEEIDYQHAFVQIESNQI